MSRRSIPEAKADDYRLRVRIKFVVPPGGVKGSTQIHRWLLERFGPKGFGVHPVRWESAQDSFAVHINDPHAVADVTKYIEDVLAERVPIRLID